MQPGGRLVEDVEGLAGVHAAQLGGQLDALGLAAGERGRGLAERDVAQADLLQAAQQPGDGGKIGEELGGLVHAHLQHVGDGAAAVEDFQRLRG